MSYPPSLAAQSRKCVNEFKAASTELARSSAAATLYLQEGSKDRALTEIAYIRSQEHKLKSTIVSLESLIRKVNKIEKENRN